jgi:hypothetical protein
MVPEDFSFASQFVIRSVVQRPVLPRTAELNRPGRLPYRSIEAQRYERVYNNPDLLVAREGDREQGVVSRVGREW